MQGSRERWNIPEQSTEQTSEKSDGDFTLLLCVFYFKIETEENHRC
jgi:hypothetical protein